jgi:hypothetical protein
MTKSITNTLKSFGIFIVLAMAFSTGCAGLNSGSEDYQEAVDAPTEPEIIDEGYEEGAQYPEESF